MDDFLVELYALIKGKRHLPREDFLSLCLGNVLRRDDSFARSLFGAIVNRRGRDREQTTQLGEREAKISAWCAEPDRAAAVIEVLAQVTVESTEYPNSGWVDLRVLLSAPGGGQGIIFEAKVGISAPTNEQLNRYKAAKEGDLIVALIQEDARKHCPTWVPVVTWDEVAALLDGAQAEGEAGSR